MQLRRLQEIGCRFASPVYPGETLRVQMWRRGKAVQCRTWAVERNAVVLSHGSARVTTGKDARARLGVRHQARLQW